MEDIVGLVFIKQLLGVDIRTIVSLVSQLYLPEITFSTANKYPFLVVSTPKSALLILDHVLDRRAYQATTARNENFGLAHG